MELLGLPLGTVFALALVCLLPLAAYALYRTDRRRGDGRVTIFGYSADEEAVQ